MKNVKKIYLYVSVFVTGALVLVLEILGARIIAPFYGSTIFVWTSQIIVTLGSLAFGYYIGGKLIDKYPSFTLYSLMIFVGGICYFVPMKIDQWVLPYTNKFGLQYGPLTAGIMLFGIPLFLLAMNSPMVIRLTMDSEKHSGSSSGSVFAFSTIGSIAGAFLAGFYLLPYYSLTSMLNVSGLILIFLSLFGFFFGEWKTSKLVLVVFLLFASYYIYRYPKYTYVDGYTGTILYHQQGYYGDLKVLDISGMRCVTVDGATESCRSTEGGLIGPYFDEISEIIDKIGAKKILILGSGGGDMLESGIGEKDVTLVDIDSQLVKLSEEYLGFRTEGRKLIIDDARHFLTNDNSKYDLIYLDLAKGAHPPFYVFSKESLELMKERLNPDGTILMHFLGGMGENDPAVASVIKTSRTVFPSVSYTTSSPDENTSIMVHASLSEEYEVPYSENENRIFTKAVINEQLGIVLTDDYNFMDLQSAEKSKKLLKSVRNYAGLKGVFAI